MKYYITWNNGATLYWNGELWQAQKEGAFIGDSDECRQEIETHGLTRTDLTPYHYDGVGYVMNQIFKS